MTTFANNDTLRARFMLFDEGNKGTLSATELANAFRSLGWSDINDHHCSVLMQRHFGEGTFVDNNDNGDDDDEDEVGEGKLDATAKTDALNTNTAEGNQKKSPKAAKKEQHGDHDDEDYGDDDEDHDDHHDDYYDHHDDDDAPAVVTEPCTHVTFKQFRKLVRTVTIPKDSGLECYKAYTLMDFTQSGIISDADLAQMALMMHGNACSARQRARMVRAILSVADTNHDELLSLPEFRGGCAKGGSGTEDGPLDLSVFVVEQPPMMQGEGEGKGRRGSYGYGGSLRRDVTAENNSNNGSGTPTHANNSSFGRANSNSAARRSAGGGHYPHASVVTTIPRNGEAATSSRSTSAGGKKKRRHSSSAVVSGDDNNEDEDEEDGDEDEEDAAATADSTFVPTDDLKTYTFEGIEVTFTNGRISKAQVEAFFVAVGDLLVGDDFERWFAVEDSDDDGYLSEEQFRGTLEVFLGDDTE